GGAAGGRRAPRGARPGARRGARRTPPPAERRGGPRIGAPAAARRKVPMACLLGPPLSLVVQAVAKPRAATTPTTCIANLRPIARRVVVLAINAVILYISVCILEH